MTPSQGFGMLLMGIIAIGIGATIAFFIINHLQKKRQEAIENKNREDIIYGRKRTYSTVLG